MVKKVITNPDSSKKPDPHCIPNGGSKELRS